MAPSSQRPLHINQFFLFFSIGLSTPCFFSAAIPENMISHHGCYRRRLDLASVKYHDLWLEMKSKMNRYSVTTQRCIHVCFRPCVEFINPVVHESITKCEMESMDANETLVVYATTEKSCVARRRIEYGPTLFMPKPNEWWAALGLCRWAVYSQG